MTAASESERILQLSESLTARLEDLESRTYKHRDYEDLIACAVGSKDLRLLERLDRHYDMEDTVLVAADDLVTSANFDAKDDELFDLLVTFIELIRYDRREPFRLAEFVPLLRQHPDRVEQITDALNRTENGRPATVHEVEQIVTSPYPHHPMSIPALEALLTSKTPVSDRRLVCRDVLSEGKWNAYKYYADYDNTTLAFLANTLRHASVGNALLEELTSDTPVERAFEYTAMVHAVSDIIVTDKDAGVVVGPNNSTFWSAWSMMIHALQNPLLNAGPMNTDEKYYQRAALLRYMLSVDDFEDVDCEHYGILYRKYKDKSGNNFTMEPDADWVRLIMRRREPQETAMLVTFFNQRGMDAAAAEDYLDDAIIGSLQDGWL